MSDDQSLQDDDEAASSEHEEGSRSEVNAEIVRTFVGNLQLEELRQGLINRLKQCAALAGPIFFDAFFLEDQTISPHIMVLIGVSLLASGVLAYCRPSPAWFAADGFICALLGGFFIYITALGRNYWSRWFPLDWVFVGVSFLLATHCFWKFNQYAHIPGRRFATLGAIVWALVGSGLAWTEALVPTPAEAHMSRGKAHLERKEYTQAIDEFTKAIAIKPKASQPWHNRGVVRRLSGDPQGAIADFTVALELSPNDAKALFKRGLCKSELRDWKGAIADATQALAVDPDLVEAYLLRGTARIAAWDVDGGKQDLEEAYKRRPDLRPPPQS